LYFIVLPTVYVFMPCHVLHLPFIMLPQPKRYHTSFHSLCIFICELMTYSDVPSEVDIKNEPAVEQLHLIEQLDEDDKITVFKIIDTMLTKKKFKDFFNKNVAAL
jgi:hypothetical protein